MKKEIDSNSNPALSPVTSRTRVRLASWAQAWLLRLMLAPADVFLRWVAPRYRAFFWVIAHTPPQLLEAVGRYRAERAVDQAVRAVPAYRDFLGGATTETVQIGRRIVPTTDKGSYVEAYSVDNRCVGGALGRRHVTIDESSGSSGTPFNWVRTQQERHASHLFVSHFARYCFGDEPMIAINAFSMGAWATGLNMGAALERNTIVKNTGPDADKILSTLDFLGPERRYLICGYPPFLRQLMEEAAKRGFPLADYHLMGLVGGEGMSEGLRDYLDPVFSPVYSGYGATDVEIGLAGETPVSVAIRRLARDNPRLRTALFGDDQRLPMLFQYNPLAHHVTVTEEGELVFTITRLEVLAPRIAYNIHDKGGVARFGDFVAALRDNGFDLAGLGLDTAPVPLPFMWVHGRSDYTVSVMGANIYPEDLEQAVYQSKMLADRTVSFLLSSIENEDGTIRPVFAFEVRGTIDATLRDRYEELIPNQIRLINADYRVAAKENPEAVRPRIELHKPGTGPFRADASKIKQTRFV